tara:strand:- start:22062 stop:22607 length:546 start_codon:yes stop_codon:yes gene_type:complete
LKITETQLKGCFILEPTVYEDERGIFFESYHKTNLEKALGKTINFVQDNISVSKKGVLRGLHYQAGKHAQSKLVQVVQGEVLDIVVDLRRESNTYGQYFKLKLSSENRKSLFIPKGMAHGFLALTPEVIFSYKCDSHYQKEAEKGIRYDDPELDIDWELKGMHVILSPKDLQLPLWQDLQL